MYSETRLLETAKASPEAVASHDKAAWLSLFAADAEVHDPVGSKPHGGAAALERFYETFIAPNGIHFNVAHDIVCGQTVVRDLVIETRMGGAPLQVNVPLFIRYEIVSEDGAPKVRRLYAHWELLPMMSQQVFKSGIGAGLIALIKLSRNMLAHQGFAGALGFSRAFSGVGAAAKKTVTAFLQAARIGDDVRASTLLAKDAALRLDNKSTGLAKLTLALKNLRWEKMLAGGRQVTVRLLLGDEVAVAVFDFDTSQNAISRITVYRNTA